MESKNREDIVKFALIGAIIFVSIFLIIVIVAQESKQPGMGSAIAVSYTHLTLPTN